MLQMLQHWEAANGHKLMTFVRIRVRGNYLCIYWLDSFTYVKE